MLKHHLALPMRRSIGEAIALRSGAGRHGVVASAHIDVIAGKTAYGHAIADRWTTSRKRKFSRPHFDEKWADLALVRCAGACS